MKLVRERLPHLRFDEEFLAKLPGELCELAPEPEPQPGSSPEEWEAGPFDISDPAGAPPPFDK